MIKTKDLATGIRQPAGNGLVERQVVLRFQEGNYQPFVTHLRMWSQAGEISHCWGHYFKTLEEAQEDFAERVKRGY